MCKVKKTSTSNKKLAPLIYVNDPTLSQEHAKALAKLIPDALTLDIAGSGYGKYPAKDKPKELGKRLIIMNDIYGDDENDWKVAHVNAIRGYGTGAHLISINIVKSPNKMPSAEGYAAHHLNIFAEPLEADTAAKIYKWLFTVLTIQESLYIISEAKMKRSDPRTCPQDSVYCPVNDVKHQHKDAKLKCVVLIVTKPQIEAGKRLTWTVADKSGTAKFFYQYRDARCQPTWDWVLSFKPGDRKTLARMPMVELKERKRVQITKAPLRVTGGIFRASGTLLSSVGTGMRKVGKIMSLGSSSEWVPERDVGPDVEKIDWNKKAKVVPTTQDKKFGQSNEEEAVQKWTDDASVASTNIASDIDEKQVKEFC